MDIGTLDTADVVVVGGGIIGLTTAFELRKRGFDVVIAEQRFLAFGASGRNPGALWMQTRRSGAELDLARRSRELYAEYEGELGATFEFRRSGGLFFYETEEQHRILEDYVADRAAQGLEISFVSKTEAAALAVALPDSALGAVYCAEDAQIDTSAFVRSLGHVCHRLGVRSFENTAVLSTIRRGDRVTGIRTVRGEIHAGGVVWATGAWAVNLRSEGIDLPIVTRRAGQLVTQPIPFRAGGIIHGPRGVATVGALQDLDSFDAETFAPPSAMRTAGNDYDDCIAQSIEGALLLGNSFDGEGSLNPHISVRATQSMIESMIERSPELGELGVTGLWAGLVCDTRDQLPIVDRVDGLYLNAAHSFGIGSGPASGEAMATLIAGESNPMVRQLSVGRATLQGESLVS